MTFADRIAALRAHAPYQRAKTLCEDAETQADVNAARATLDKAIAETDPGNDPADVRGALADFYEMLANTEGLL